MEEMEEYHMTRRALMAVVSGVLVRSRQRLVWMDGMKVVRQQRNDCGGCATMRKDGKVWRAFNAYIDD